MRNKYPGTCYRCGKRVEPGDGHFERLGPVWRVQHAHCAIEYRGQPDAARIAQNEKERHSRLARWQRQAAGTGKAAQRARRKLRDIAGTQK